MLSCRGGKRLSNTLIIRIVTTAGTRAAASRELRPASAPLSRYVTVRVTDPRTMGSATASHDQNCEQRRGHDRPGGDRSALGAGGRQHSVDQGHHQQRHHHTEGVSRGPDQVRAAYSADCARQQRQNRAQNRTDCYCGRCAVRDEGQSGGQDPDRPPPITAPITGAGR